MLERRGPYALPIARQTLPDPQLLGQKGAGLVTMRHLGLRVPPGIILTTELYRAIRRDIRSGDDRADVAPSISDALWVEVWAELEPALAAIEATRWPGGGAGPPMLWAVRSGAPVSMPGMLDSILNLGLNAQTVVALGAWSGSRRFAIDCHRRFLRQYAQSVLGVSLLQRQRLGSSLQRADLDADADELGVECAALQEEIRQRTGRAVPDEPKAQLRAAIEAVLRSFLAPRVRDYLHLTGLPLSTAELGTAVVVQAMVFGNRSASSGTGVIFSRDPSTGEPVPYGEFLPCAQGEDVVSGTAMPQPLGELALSMPAVYAELCQAAKLLERHAGDLQDIEFTVEERVLWLLQARSGKRSGRAMVRIAADLAREGLLSPSAALQRIEPRRLTELLYPTVDKAAPRTLVARGLPASPGVAIGRVVFSVADVQAHAEAGTPTILVRTDTSTDDIRGIQLAAGVLTSRGGMTSHAAVVARGLGRCAVVGASSISVDYRAQQLSTREHTVGRGELLTVDGNTGDVLLGAMPLSTGHVASNRDLFEILDWSKQRRLRIYAVADASEEWQQSRELGAEGIGLCRTESLLIGRDAAIEASQLLSVLRNPDPAAQKPLVDSLRAELTQRLAALPKVPVYLRLFDPDAARVLLSLDSPAAQADELSGEPLLSAIWDLLLQALLEARMALEQRGIEVRPQLLLPYRLGVGSSTALGSAALRLRTRQSELAAEQHSDRPLAPIGLAIQVGDLASFRAVTAASPSGAAPDSASASWDCVVLAVRGLDEIRDGLQSAVRAAKSARPELHLGLCVLGGGKAQGIGERSVMGWLEGLGLEFVACPPLAMAVAAVATAQAHLEVNGRKNDNQK